MEIDKEIFNIMLAKSMHQIVQIEFRNSKFPYTRDSQGGAATLQPQSGGSAPWTPTRGLAPWNPCHWSTIWAPPFPAAGSGPAVHNWQKWKSAFLTCPCHEIYRVEAVGLKSSSYTLEKWWFLWICEIWGNFMKNWYFVNYCFIKVRI